MLIINKNSVRALRDRLAQGHAIDECRAELKHMIEIKQAILWRSERSCACVGTSLPGSLAWEVETLEAALSAAENGRIADAVSMLDAYVLKLESERDDEPAGP